MNAGANRRLLATGSYQRSDGLGTWWWSGGVDVTRAGLANVDSPSYVCWHPSLPLLYAVSELDDGLLTTLMVSDDGSLTVLGTMPTGGSQPCWVTTDPVGLSLMIANYDVAGGASSMAVIGLSEDGIPVGDAIVVPHTGSGPVAGRQEAAHVHQVVPTAEGTVLASDLGTDQLVEYVIDPVRGAPRGDVTVTEVSRVAMFAGSGPRHISLAADGVTGFVTGELDGTVTVIRRSGGDGSGGTGSARWHADQQVSCSGQGGARANADPGFVAPSHVALGPGQRYLLVANRGPATLAVLDVTRGFEIVTEVPVSEGPRDFTVRGDLIFVSCQQAGIIEVHRLDEFTGAVTRLGVLRSDGHAVRLAGASCAAISPR